MHKLIKATPCLEVVVLSIGKLRSQCDSPGGVVVAYGLVQKGLLTVD